MGKEDPGEVEETRRRSHGVRKLDQFTTWLNHRVMVLARYWWTSLGIVAALMTLAWIFDYLTARDLIGLGAFAVGVAALVSSRAVANDAASRTALSTFFELVRRYDSPAIADGRTAAIESRDSGGTDDVAVTRVFNLGWLVDELQRISEPRAVAIPCRRGLD